MKNECLPWKTYLGQEVTAKIAKGASPRWQGFEYQKEGILFITSENVRDGFLNISEPKFLPLAFHKKQKNSQLLSGDVLVNIVGASIGRSCIYRGQYGQANVNQAVCILRPNEKTLSEYLLYYFQAPGNLKKLLGEQAATARPNLSLAHFRKFTIHLPEKSEQQIIVNILASWDVAIEKAGRLIEEKNKRLRWLTCKLILDPAARMGSYKQVKICDISDRVQRTSDGVSYPILTIASASGFVLQEVKYSRFMAGKSLEDYILLKEDEFAYNKGNSLRYQFGCVFQLKNYKAALVPHVYVCFKLHSDVDASYLGHVFDADYLKRQLGSLVNTGVRNNGLLNIRPDDFMEVTVPIPPVDVQKRIAATLNTARYEIDLIRKQVEAYRKQKRSLMQKLLTGEWRVKSFREKC